VFCDTRRPSFVVPVPVGDFLDTKGRQCEWVSRRFCRVSHNVISKMLPRERLQHIFSCLKLSESPMPGTFTVARAMRALNSSE
jgi:hypothetical protein